MSSTGQMSNIAPVTQAVSEADEGRKLSSKSFGSDRAQVLILTLQAVCIQQLLTLLVTFDSALRAAHALMRDAPKKPLTLVTVGGRCGRPYLKVVRCCTRNGVD